MNYIETEKTYTTFKDGTVAEVKHFELDMTKANVERKKKDDILDFLFSGLNVKSFEPRDAFDLFADWLDDYSDYPDVNYISDNINAFDVMFYIERKRGLVK